MKIIKKIHFVAMKKMKTTPIIFCLILLGCLLSATGCVSESTVKNQLSNTTDVVTSIPIVMPITLVTPIPTECPVPGNGSYWINIDPISNVSVGNPVFINGTTNIPAGMDLNFEISKVQWRALPHYTPPHVSGIVEIIRTDDCTNKFSFFSNTSDLGDLSLFEVYVWTEDTHLSGYNFPANRSEFYIIRLVNP